jgi:hypothetical protein
MLDHQNGDEPDRRASHEVCHQHGGPPRNPVHYHPAHDRERDRRYGAAGQHISQSGGLVVHPQGL